MRISTTLFGAAVLVLASATAKADGGHHDDDHDKGCCQKVTLTTIEPSDHGDCRSGGVRISTTCSCGDKDKAHGHDHDAHVNGGHDDDDSCTPQEAVVCNGAPGEQGPAGPEGPPGPQGPPGPPGQNGTGAAYTATNPTNTQIFPGPPGTLLAAVDVPPGSYVVEAKATIEGDTSGTQVVCQIADLLTPLIPIDSQVVTPDSTETTALLGPLTTATGEQIDFTCYLTQGAPSEVRAYNIQLAAKQVNPLVSTGSVTAATQSGGGGN